MRTIFLEGAVKTMNQIRTKRLLILTARALVLLGLLAFFAVPCSAEEKARKKAAAKPGKKDLAEVAAGNNRFALDLYAKLAAGRKGKNLFFSPNSISTALAMTRAGARGNTAKEMDKVLHFTLAQDKLNPAFKELLAALDADPKKKGFELAVANRLWGQQGYNFLPGFLATTRDSYGAGLEALDFKGATEAARRTINAWVEKKTKDKIKELLKQGVLSPDMRLVLTNAIYFKGDWASQFKKDRTRDGVFTVKAGETVKVPMMHQTEKFRYRAGKGFQALGLPYAGDELSMVIFLPTKADGLAALEKSLTAENLDQYLPARWKRKVVVSIPKFTMTSEFSLKETLSAMGMKDAFAGGKADFSGMDGSRGLFIGAVIHKAFVDVNEEGTEAAAATAVVVGVTSMPAPPPVFRADRPFLFMIRDDRTGSILFMGRVMNPKG